MAEDIVFSSASGSGLSSGSGNISMFAEANCSLSVPSRTPGFILAVQLVVGTVCVLSIAGSALILFTFVYFRDLRTTARQFLANLSVADSIIAASHLVGLLVNYDRFLCSSAKDYDALCTVQAAASMFSTLAAFAWTLAIAVYLCSIIVFNKNASTWSVVLVYAACWGVPAALVIGYGSASYLGFDEDVDIGWCYLRRINYSKQQNHRNPLPHLLAYELWTYTIFLLLPVLYLWVQCYIKIKLKSSSFFTDIKLLFIPVLFLLLRVWNFILDTYIIYTPDHKAEEFKASRTAAWLIVMSGIGDSAQGIANAVLFIGLTRVVRKRLLQLLLRVCCRRDPQRNWKLLQETDQMESSRHAASGDRRRDEERECEDTSSLDGSLEALRVLSFQSSVSSYGTTTGN